MDEIPLDDIVPPPPPQQPVNQDEDWHQRYKTLIGTAIAYILQLALEDSTKWSIVEPLERIALFERPVNVDGYCIFKVQGVVAGRADRYLYVIKDHDKDTRCPWDTDVLHVQQLETYMSNEGNITVVRSTIKSPLPRIIAPRVLLGLQWTDYDTQLQTHKLVFCSAQHPFFKCLPTEGVEADARIGIIIRQLDKGQCELCMFVRVNPGGALGSLWIDRYKEALRARIYLYESVVQAWSTYYGPGKDPKKLENRK